MDRRKRLLLTNNWSGDESFPIPVAGTITFSGTDIIVPASSAINLTTYPNARYGVDYGYYEFGAADPGYVFSRDVAAAALNQSLTLTTALDGYTATSLVNVRSWVDLENNGTKVYSSAYSTVVDANPSISGTAEVGETLTATNPLTVGAYPISHAYSWLLCDGSGDNCSAIGGETAATYLIDAGDEGDTIRVLWTASGVGYPSGATAAVTAAGVTFKAGAGISGNGVTGSLALPSNSAGDLLVLMICSSNEAVQPVPDDAGWAALTGASVIYSSTFTGMKVYIAESGDVSNADITQGFNNGYTAICYSLSGADLAGPSGGEIATAIDDNGSGTITAPDVTAGTGYLHVVSYVMRDTQTAWTGSLASQLPGYTESPAQMTAGGGLIAGNAGYKEVSAAPGAQTRTGSGFTQKLAISMAFPPA